MEGLIVFSNAPRLLGHQPWRGNLYTHDAHSAVASFHSNQRAAIATASIGRRPASKSVSGSLCGPHRAGRTCAESTMIVEGWTRPSPGAVRHRTKRGPSFSQTHPTFRKAVKSAACNRSARARNLPLSAPTYSRQRTESVTVRERGVSKSLQLSRTANLYVYPYWVRHNLSDDPALAKTHAEVGAASCESPTRCEIGLAGGVACRFKRPTHQSSCGIAMTTEPSGGLAWATEPVGHFSIHRGTSRFYSE